MNEIDILLLSKWDYANAGYLYARALQSIGVKAESWAVKPSPRTYLQHSNLFKSLRDEIIPRADKAKAIQFMHSRRFSIPIHRKFVTVFHGGSRYRHLSERMNETFNPIVDKSIIQTGDLLNKGAKNEIWILPPADIELLGRQESCPNSDLLFAHYPHKRAVKGSDGIEKILEKVYKEKRSRNWDFQIDDSPIPWRENIERMSRCDVYIEAVNPEIRGEAYGEWGLTALEAAAMGKIVITHFRSYGRYLMEYGECPLLIANNSRELEMQIRYVLDLNLSSIRELKEKTREWVREHHSFQAVGQRLVDKVYGEIL